MTTSPDDVIAVVLAEVADLAIGAPEVKATTFLFVAILMWSSQPYLETDRNVATDSRQQNATTMRTQRRDDDHINLFAPPLQTMESHRRTI